MMNTLCIAPAAKNLNPPLEKSIEFIRALFAPDDLITLRTIESWFENGKKESKVHSHDHLRAKQLFNERCWQVNAESAESQNACQFFGVCPRPEPWANLACNIRTVRCLWSDIDHTTPEQALAKCKAAKLPEPSIVVCSGNGVHLYWLLENPELIEGASPKLAKIMDHEGKVSYRLGNTTVKPSDLLAERARYIQGILAGIAEQIGGDTTTDLSRLLRLPGTANRKDARNGAKPTQSYIVEISDRRYPLSAFASFVVQPKPQKAKDDAPRKSFASLSDRQQEWFDSALEKCQQAERGSRSEVDFGLCCTVCKLRLDPDEVWDVVQDVGKFADAGRSYFDRTWSRAEAIVETEIDEQSDEFAELNRFFSDEYDFDSAPTLAPGLFANAKPAEVRSIVAPPPITTPQKPQDEPSARQAAQSVEKGCEPSNAATPPVTKGLELMQPASKKDEFAELRNDPLYSYLWQGVHGEYRSDAERRRRIESTKEALAFVPENSFFTDYLAYAMPTTDAPTFYHVVSALSIASHLINRKAWLVSGTDSYVANLWLCVIAQSSTGRKSSSINPARDFLANDPDYGLTMQGNFTIAALLADLGVQFRKDDTDQKLPSLDEVKAQCGHDEGLIPQYAKGLAYIHLNEISLLLSALNKSYNDDGKAILTDIYDYAPFKVKKTSTQNCYYIHKPFISMLAATSPEWLADGCRENDLKGGFLPRWLFVANGRQDYEQELRPAPDMDAKARVRNSMERFKTFRGELRLSKDAERFFVQWYKSFVSGVSGDIATWTARLVVYAHKIAIVYAACRNEHEISKSTFVLATRLIEQVRADLEQLLRNDISFDRHERQCQKLLKYLRRQSGKVSHSAIMHATHFSASEMRQVAETCHGRGAIELHRDKAANGKEVRFYSLAT